MKSSLLMIIFYAVIFSLQGLQVDEVGSVELPSGNYSMITTNGDFFSVDFIRDDEEITIIKYISNTDLETEVDTLDAIPLPEEASYDDNLYVRQIDNFYLFSIHIYNNGIRNILIIKIAMEDENYTLLEDVYINGSMPAFHYGFSNDNIYYCKQNGIYRHDFNDNDELIYELTPSYIYFTFLKLDDTHLFINYLQGNFVKLYQFDDLFSSIIDTLIVDNGDLYSSIFYDYKSISLSNDLDLFRGGSTLGYEIDFYFSTENNQLSFESTIINDHQTFLFEFDSGEMLYGYGWGGFFENEQEILVKVDIYNYIIPIETYGIYDVHKIINYSEDHFLLMSHNHAMAGADYHTLFYVNKNNFYDGSFTEIPISEKQFYDGEYLYLYSSGQFMKKLIVDPLDNEEEAVEPKKIKISNFPNPFNPSTTIDFSLPEGGMIDVSIFNIKGQKVKTLLNQEMEEGNHQIQWHGKDESGNSVSSGVYFYQLNINGITKSVNKCLMIK